MTPEQVDRPADQSRREWWRSAAVYQIYPRSFADGNGDGTGDVAGMRNRLPYLAELGIDAIWVNPWYRSPLLDGGYDVADYREINDLFGTTAEAEAFIAEARDLGIRVIVDLVPNHLSFQHRWFVDAVTAGAGSPERARFHFLPGRGDDGELPPNDWPSVFGGPAWTQVDDGTERPEWYLHMFDHSQPDVNWENPEVRDELEAVMRFWLDRGAAGFRVDVAHSLMKAPGYPDLNGQSHRDGPAWTEGHPFWDRDEVHDVIRRWRTTLDSYDDDRMMVAEAWVRADRLPLYLRPDEYHQAFDFDFLTTDWDAADFAAVINRSVSSAAAVGSSPTWVLSNHDVVRHATRYGFPNGTKTASWPMTLRVELLDEARGQRRARAACLVTLGLPGSVYVYQGEELGLGEVFDLPDDVLDDPVWVDSDHRFKGRDGCRVPLPWEPDGPSMGFGVGDAWLPQPERFRALAASAQDGDPRSMLTLYRSALALRREVLTDDITVEVLDGDVDVLAFQRGGGVRCVVNMGDVAVPMPHGQLLLSSDVNVDQSTDELPPDTAVWMR